MSLFSENSAEAWDLISMQSQSTFQTTDEASDNGWNLLFVQKSEQYLYEHQDEKLESKQVDNDWKVNEWKNSVMDTTIPGKTVVGKFQKIKIKPDPNKSYHVSFSNEELSDAIGPYVKQNSTSDRHLRYNKKDGSRKRAFGGHTARHMNYWSQDPSISITRVDENKQKVSKDEELVQVSSIDMQHPSLTSMRILSLNKNKRWEILNDPTIKESYKDTSKVKRSLEKCGKISIPIVGSVLMNTRKQFVSNREKHEYQRKTSLFEDAKNFIWKPKNEDVCPDNKSALNIETLIKHFVKFYKRPHAYKNPYSSKVFGSKALEHTRTFRGEIKDSVNTSHRTQKYNSNLENHQIQGSRKNKSNKNEFVEIDFGKNVLVKGIETLGAFVKPKCYSVRDRKRHTLCMVDVTKKMYNYPKAYVTKFALFTRTDGGKWYRLDDVIGNNSPREKHFALINPINNGVLARYIRLKPIDYVSEPIFRFALYGEDGKPSLENIPEEQNSHVEYEINTLPGVNDCAIDYGSNYYSYCNCSYCCGSEERVSRAKYREELVKFQHGSTRSKVYQALNVDTII